MSIISPGGVGTNAKEAEAARVLIKFLTAPAAIKAVPSVASMKFESSAAE